eukprot:gene17448-biopygen15907
MRTRRTTRKTPSCSTTGVCPPAPRGLPARPPRRRGADGHVAVGPPVAPLAADVCWEIDGMGGRQGARPPHSAAGLVGTPPPARCWARRAHTRRQRG